MAFFRLPRFNLHHSKWSDRYLGPPSGSGVNFGTPELKIAVDSNSIRIPISKIKDGVGRGSGRAWMSLDRLCRPTGVAFRSRCG